MLIAVRAWPVNTILKKKHRKQILAENLKNILENCGGDHFRKIHSKLRLWNSQKLDLKSERRFNLTKEITLKNWKNLNIFLEKQSGS